MWYGGWGDFREEGIGKKEEGRRKREEGIGKKEEGIGKKGEWAKRKIWEMDKNSMEIL